MAQNVGRFESLFSAAGDTKQASEPNRPRVQDSYEDLDRKYRHRTYQAQELMIEKLLRGQFLDHHALERKLHMFDLNFQYPDFILVLVCPAGNASTFSDYASDLRDGGQVGLIVCSIFSELLGERFDCYPANLEDRYAFLVNYTDFTEATSQVEEICRYGVRFIQDNFAIELQVCISNVCNGIDELHEAFHETERMAVDTNTMYHEGVSLCLDISTRKRMEPSIEKPYLNALVTQDFHMALELTQERVRELYKQTGEMERVRRFINMRMQTTGSVLSIPIAELVDEHNHGRFLEHCDTIEDVERELQRIYTRLDTNYNLSATDYTGTTGKVIHLISRRYMEPDLSVEMICDSLGKSRSYLSRMFKENTGMNLLDYLHTTRLTEAKKLLNETDLGISEIATKVGYYSGWTLARVFKRYEGITPTAYRKAYSGGGEM